MIDSALPNTTTPNAADLAGGDGTGLFSIGWQLADWPESDSAAEVTVWQVVSWGPSASADLCRTALRRDCATAEVIRTILATTPDSSVPDAASLWASAPSVIGERRVILFLDGATTVDAADCAWRWAWAHAALHACQQAAQAARTRLWLVTATGLLGPVASGTARPEQYFAWGLGRCHAVESPESWGGLIDIDPRDPAAGDAVARFLTAGPSEDEVVLTPDGALVPRLAEVSGLRAMPLGFNGDSLFVLTGGLGGLSFEIAHWLGARGARHLLILGRSPLDSGRDERLLALQTLCGHVEYQALDVGDPALVRTLTARLKTEGRRIGGIFHLASSWQRDGRTAVGPLAQVTREDTEEVLHAKAQGALLMAELARQTDADLLVLFSTAAATLGSPGQANYAGANSVLDGAARQFEGSRTRALSIAWGPIAEVGFGNSEQGRSLHEVWERVGLRRMRLSQVLATLDGSLDAPESHLIAISVDANQGLSLPWLQSRPIFQDLSDAVATGLLLPRLAELTEAERIDFIAQTLRSSLATILNLDEQDVGVAAPLADLGVDSLVALEMLFTVERDFGVSLGFDETLLGMDVTLQVLAREIDQRLPVRATETAA
jgi:erythronolide synthase